MAIGSLLRFGLCLLMLQPAFAALPRMACSVEGPTGSIPFGGSALQERLVMHFDGTRHAVVYRVAEWISHADENHGPAKAWDAMIVLGAIGGLAYSLWQGRPAATLSLVVVGMAINALQALRPPSGNELVNLIFSHSAFINQAALSGFTLMDLRLAFGGISGERARRWLADPKLAGLVMATASGSVSPAQRYRLSPAGMARWRQINFPVRYGISARDGMNGVVPWAEEPTSKFDWSGEHKAQLVEQLRRQLESVIADPAKFELLKSRIPGLPYANWRRFLNRLRFFNDETRDKLFSISTELIHGLAPVPAIRLVPQTKMPRPLQPIRQAA